MALRSSELLNEPINGVFLAGSFSFHLRELRDQHAVHGFEVSDIVFNGRRV